MKVVSKTGPAAFDASGLHMLRVFGLEEISLGHDASAIKRELVKEEVDEEEAHFQLVGKALPLVCIRP